MKRKPKKPALPKKPDETIELWPTVMEFRDDKSFNDLLEELQSKGVPLADVRICGTHECSGGYCDSSWGSGEDAYIGDAGVLIERREIVPNPHYDYYKKKYDEAMAAYPQKLAEYEAQLKVWKRIKTEQKAERERKKKLKKMKGVQQKLWTPEREAMWQRIKPD